MHCAARMGANEKLITLLLQHGGDPLRPNSAGQTAIDIAKAAKKSRVVEQLKGSGK